MIIRDAVPADHEVVDAFLVDTPGWAGSALVADIVASSPHPATFSVVEDAGELLAAGGGNFGPVAGPGRGIAQVFVAEPARRRGAGRLLFDDVVARGRTAGLRQLMFPADEADTTSLAVAAAHGLVLGGLHLQSELDLTGSLPAVDLPVVPLPVDTLAGRDALFAAVQEVEPDMPDESRLDREVFDGVVVAGWQGVVVYDGEELAGFTIAVRVDDEVANTFLTGVRPPWRGRGWSTQLKAAGAAMLHDHGYRVLRTQNMDVNTAILAANDRLGFRRVSAGRELILTL